MFFLLMNPRIRFISSECEIDVTLRTLLRNESLLSVMHEDVVLKLLMLGGTAVQIVLLRDLPSSAFFLILVEHEILGNSCATRVSSLWCVAPFFSRTGVDEYSLKVALLASVAALSSTGFPKN